MHVCLVNAASEFGGVEVHTMHLARFLTERGHQVSLVVLGNSVFEGRLNGLEKLVEVIRIPQERSLDKLSFSSARRLVGRMPGVACIWEKGSLDVGSLKLDLAARLRFHRYLTIEQLEAEPMPERSSRQHFGGVVPGIGLWWYRWWIARHVRCLGPQKIVCVSQSVHDRLVEHYSFPRRKMIVAHNSIDTSRFFPDQESRENVRQRWCVKPTTLVFGAMARFNEIKRLNVAIECFSHLVRELPDRDMQLVLVGEGYEENKLRTLVQNLSLEGRVSFLPFTTQPAETLNGFDFFVMPSGNEGLPFALLEAMACGCPAIATDVGGNREVLAVDTGWLVPANDDDAFLKAMRHAAALTGEERRRMGVLARESVVSKFDQTRQLGTITALLEN